jgi:hypothetical protein
MHGPAARLIQSRGLEYTVRNASGGGGRDTPSYSEDGTLVAVLERRSRSGQTATDSDGTEVDVDLEFRAVPDESVTIREAGSADGYPTLLEHPNGRTYRVIAETPEDSGVTALSVVRN